MSANSRSRARVDADRVHSLVRESSLVARRRIFSGRVARRAVFPAALLEGFETDHNGK
jgi:hypothetical protein